MTKEPIAIRKSSLRALLFVLDNSKTGRKDYITIIRAATFSRDEIQRLTDVIQGDSAVFGSLKPATFVEVPEIRPVTAGTSVRDFVGEWTGKANLKTAKSLGLTYLGEPGSEVIRDWMMEHTGMMRNPAYGDYVFCVTNHTESQSDEAKQEAMQTLTRFHVDIRNPE